MPTVQKGVFDPIKSPLKSVVKSCSLNRQAEMILHQLGRILVTKEVDDCLWAVYQKQFWLEVFLLSLQAITIQIFCKPAVEESHTVLIYLLALVWQQVVSAKIQQTEREDDCPE
jgi:hypothetical protein